MCLSKTSSGSPDNVIKLGLAEGRHLNQRNGKFTCLVYGPLLYHAKLGVLDGFLDGFLDGSFLCFYKLIQGSTYPRYCRTYVGGAPQATKQFSRLFFLPKF